MTQMALNGADLIFTTSFGYMDPTINVAAKFPNVKFEHATGYKQADNVSRILARFYEGRAVQGHIAGQMTKSNIVGYIGHSRFQKLCVASTLRTSTPKKLILM